jgi:hypothetical protein
MRSVNRKIETLLKKQAGCLGFSEQIIEVTEARVDLEHFVRDEVEGLLKEIEANKHADLVNRGPG